MHRWMERMECLKSGQSMDGSIEGLLFRFIIRQENIKCQKTFNIDKIFPSLPPRKNNNSVQFAFFQRLIRLSLNGNIIVWEREIPIKSSKFDAD